jgi:hypothetical protein
LRLLLLLLLLLLCGVLYLDNLNEGVSTVALVVLQWVTYLNLELLALLLDALDLRLDSLDLLLDEFQTAVHGHERLGLVLLQQHGADLLVDVCFVVEDVEFLHRRLSPNSNLQTVYRTFLTVVFSCCCDSSLWRDSTAVPSSALVVSELFPRG